MYVCAWEAYTQTYTSKNNDSRTTIYLEKNDLGFAFSLHILLIILFISSYVTGFRLYVYKHLQPLTEKPYHLWLCGCDVHWHPPVEVN